MLFFFLNRLTLEPGFSTASLTAEMPSSADTSQSQMFTGYT
jgi:hypothetical protein